ncbi:MAG: ABC transporter ATP-binding protein, partial [Dehalococcoidia bacterium]
TNDLDIETIGVLEDYLMQYKGTILLVSHDRAFINNIVAGTMVFEGDAVVKEYVGGYDDWLSMQQPRTKPAKPAAVKKEVHPAKLPKAVPKLSFKQRKELELLPHTIESLEEEQAQLFQAMGDPDLYKKDRAEVLAMQERMDAVKKLLVESYERWQELELLSSENSGK